MTAALIVAGIGMCGGGTAVLLNELKPQRTIARPDANGLCSLAQEACYGSRPDSDQNSAFGDAPSESPSPSPSETSPSSEPATSEPTQSSRPPKPHHSAKPPKAAAGAERRELPKSTCKAYGDANHGPIIRSLGGMSVIVDTRYKDGCDYPFYSGATLYKGASTESGKKDVGTSLQTAGSLALNGSVLRVTGIECGQTRHTTAQNGGDMPDDTWLKVSVNGESAHVAAVDVGYPDVSTFQNEGGMHLQATQYGNC